MTIDDFQRTNPNFKESEDAKERRKKLTKESALEKVKCLDLERAFKLDDQNKSKSTKE